MRVPASLRLCRLNCEEQRRLVADLELLAQRLRSDSSRLRGDIAAAAPEANELSADALIERHAKLAHSLAEVEAQLAAALDAFAAAEADLEKQERAVAERSRTSDRGRQQPPRPRPGGMDGAATRGG